MAAEFSETALSKIGKHKLTCGAVMTFIDLASPVVLSEGITKMVLTRAAKNIVGWGTGNPLHYVVTVGEIAFVGGMTVYHVINISRKPKKAKWFRARHNQQ
jgi:hypothetical protein